MSGAAPFRYPRTSRPRDFSGEESDGDSKTPTSSVVPSEEEEGLQSSSKWRVGDACVATWAGDEQLYPAHLRALDLAAGTCVVEFDSYGITQEHPLADLLPPCPGFSGFVGDEDFPSSWDSPPIMRKRKGKQVPQPPEEEEEDSALAAMLMAWYMSGYHTGFYVGLQEGRAEAAKGSLRPVRRQKPPRI